MARKKAKALPPKMITVYAEILQETELAILVRCDEDSDGVWLPKSQIKYEGERGDTGVEIEIPELMADEKGFFEGMGWTEVEAPAAPAEVAPAEAEQETVTLVGTVRNFRDVEDGTSTEIIFVLDYEDEEGRDAEAEHVIPVEQVLSKELNAEADDSITISRAYALEAGIVEDSPEEEPSASETSADKRVFGDNVKWIKEEKITVSTPLTDSEKARYAEEMAALDKEIEELEDERSAISSRLKKQIDAKEQERREMSAHVNDGELRTFSCDCLKDYNSGEMVWTEAYPPYNEVQRRKMTKEEMQPSLLEYSEKTAKPSDLPDTVPFDDAPGEFAEASDDGTSFDESEGVDFDAVAAAEASHGDEDPAYDTAANPEDDHDSGEDTDDDYDPVVAATEQEQGAEAVQ